MKEGNFFNTLFYFEIISDSKEVVKIVQRVPVYPSPSFRHDKIFTAPEHIGNTRKRGAVPAARPLRPRPRWAGASGCGEASGGPRRPAGGGGEGGEAPGWVPAPPLLWPAAWHQALRGHVTCAPHPTGRQACRPQNRQTAHWGDQKGPSYAERLGGPTSC